MWLLWSLVVWTEVCTQGFVVRGASWKVEHAVRGVGEGAVLHKSSYRYDALTTPRFNVSILGSAGAIEWQSRLKIVRIIDVTHCIAELGLSPLLLLLFLRLLSKYLI